MPTFYCNYYFLLGTRGPLTLWGPLDFAYPAYPIVTPLSCRQLACMPKVFCSILAKMLHAKHLSRIAHGSKVESDLIYVLN